MTQILGIINDSVGQPLDGTLTVSLPFSTLFNNAVHTQILEEYAITAGVVDINLPATNINNAVYDFSFRDSSDRDLFKFSAGVPDDISAIQFSNLFPTGVTNRNLDTSTFALAKRITEEPLLAEQFKQVSLNTVEFEGLDTAFIRRFPKPFAGALKIDALTTLDSENLEDWTIECGFVLTDGTDGPVLTPESISSDDTGLTYERQQFLNQTSSPTIKGVYIKATPDIGARPLTAVVSVGYIEV
jgi:hypothetical protein